MRIRVALFLSALGLLCRDLPAHEPHDAIDVVAVSPNFAQDQTVIAAFDDFTLNAGVFGDLISTDGGVTWSAIQGLPSNTGTSAVVFSPGYAQDQSIYIAGPGGLWGTANRGVSWTVLKSGPFTSLALSPNFATDNTMFLVASTAVYESTDRGNTWKTLSAPTSGLTVIATSPNFAADHTVVLGTTASGIYESINGGAMWVQVTTGTIAPISAFAFSPKFATDGTAYAGSNGSGMLVSTNHGTTWAFRNAGLTDLNITSLASSATYAQDSTIFAATAASGVFLSTNAGSTWTLGAVVNRHLSPQTSKHYRSIAATQGAAGMPYLYLVMWEGLWLSTNKASSFQYIDTIPTRMIRQINLSPNYANDQTVYVTTYGSGTIWSTNGGSSWTIRNTGMNVAYTDPSALSPNFAVDQTAFNGDFDGLQKTTNAGASWVLLRGGQPGPTYIRTIAVSPNYAKDSTLLLGTMNGPVTCPTSGGMGHTRPAASTASTGLFLSTDGGMTWGSTSLTRPVSSGCWGILGSAISPAFASDHTAFATSPNSGIYKSTDGGLNWTQVLSTVSSTIVVTSPNYANDQTVFAGGFLQGIYKSTDGGTTWNLLPQTAGVRALDIHVSPNYANDQMLYAATIQRGLMQFTNGGSTVTTVISFPDTFVTAVGLSPNFGTDHTIFAAGYHGLYKSTDGAVSWSYTNAPARTEDTRNTAGPGQPGPDIIYQGSWALAGSPPSSTDSVMQTGVSGDTATFNFYGASVNFLTYLGPTQGNVSITLDGVYQTTVSLAESPGTPDKYQQIVWKKQGLLCGLHTLTITAVLGSGQTAPVDAFDVGINGCEPAAATRYH